METTKEKIDRALGLTSGQSIDDFLDNMALDASKASQAMDSISEEVHDSLAAVDDQLQDFQKNPSSSLTIADLDASMKEIEDLIVMSKAIFKHIYENIVSSELIDSELIGSTSKMLESIHINIAEFIGLYRDKMKFVEKVKMMLFQQNLKKELMDKKHQQDLEKMKLKAESNVVDATVNPSSLSMSQEDAVKMLSKMSGDQLDNMLGIPSDKDVQEEVSAELAEDNERQDKQELNTKE